MRPPRPRRIPTAKPPLQSGGLRSVLAFLIRHQRPCPEPGSDFILALSHASKRPESDIRALYDRVVIQHEKELARQGKVAATDGAGVGASRGNMKEQQS